MKALKHLTLFSLALISFSSSAGNKEECVKKWEYYSKSYQLGSDSEDKANWRLAAGLSKEGEKGWEFVQSIAVGKIQYMVFKRQKNECVAAADLKTNPGLKKK